MKKINTKTSISKMSKSKLSKIFSKVLWIVLVVQRFARVDRKGRSAVTSALSTLGIAFGVMTLIAVVSVMNGFQMGFKDAIIELSSYHIRAKNLLENNAELQSDKNFLSWANQNKEIICATPFLEAQSLVAGNYSREQACVVRAVPQNICQNDLGFQKEIGIIAGKFDLSESGSIVIGASLAKDLSVRVGSTVNLLALSGGSDVQLFSQDRTYKVTGIFRCGYIDINQTYAFINLEDGEKEFGKSSPKIYGIKTRHPNSRFVMNNLQKQIAENFSFENIEMWQSYNRSFFDVLRVEKNILMLFVFLIFVVVGINIYNGMNRLVFERQTEISVFSALGASKSEIQTIFIAKGFLTGSVGAFLGVVLGLFLSVNSAAVFRIVSSVMFFVGYLFVQLTNPSYASYFGENSMYMVYASIPARIIFGEVFLIAFFGFCAPLVASFLASKKILSMTVAEVLHDE